MAFGQRAAIIGFTLLTGGWTAMMWAITQSGVHWAPAVLSFAGVVGLAMIITGAYLMMRDPEIRSVVRRVEPVYLIAIGLLVAFGGLGWHFYRGQATAKPKRVWTSVVSAALPSEGKLIGDPSINWDGRDSRIVFKQDFCAAARSSRFISISVMQEEICPERRC